MAVAAACGCGGGACSPQGEAERARDTFVGAVESARRVPGAAAEALSALAAWLRVWDAVVQHRGRGPAGGGVSSPPLR